MSAKRATALLVIVALSLLLASGSALSRPEMAPRDVDTGTGLVTQGDGDGPDSVDPGTGVPGDDDNWDKPSTDGHGPTDAVVRADGGWIDEGSGSRLPDVDEELAMLWLKLLLRLW
ncbi:MAG: hypothetical protein GF400_01895 [Candidatus Eisenbacteria bacterium]|nr:hypothetical protein [Candidatus Eisenbacteria bacterium]